MFSGVGKFLCQGILEAQPDFQEQHLFVQEVIEAAGHLCIFLPKFHCELNFIEYFWGALKKYLRDHYDYTFKTLQENLPKVLEPVAVKQSGSGSIGCGAGWKPMIMGLPHTRLSFMFRSWALGSVNPTGRYQRVWVLGLIFDYKIDASIYENSVLLW